MRYLSAIAALLVFAVPTVTSAQSNHADAPTKDVGRAFTRVTGIGGIFLKAKDPEMMRAWYQKHLGIATEAWGGTAFGWADSAGKTIAGQTVRMISDGKNFAPSPTSVMMNFRVADLHKLLAALRAEGCNVLDKTEESEFGKFGWVIDPEGNKLELWQPPTGS